ncbi:MAG TPA: N-acetylmuramoyl-L-alanine amidase [Kofleriaceae bacterium]|nr:N-acetylmuramoyl-L-alanine amidase [Kofleriaceae bacterium]
MLPLLLACACADDGDRARETDPRDSALDREFAAAADEFGVPVDLLKAIGYVETRWEMVAGAEEHEGLAPASGVMALRGEALARGAQLAALDARAAGGERESNIRAAAALMAELAAELAIDTGDLRAWAPVVAALSGIDDPEGQAEQVQRVYAVLREGVAAGQLAASIEPHDVEPDFIVPQEAQLAAVNFPGAIWRPSPNYNSRNGWSVHAIVIHTCEGSYTSCWSWLRNPAAQASAHYVVSESGNEVSQLVDEANRAWHVAASYDCSRVEGHDCGKNGVSVNNFSVGIEHGGFASQSSFPPGQIETSARLSCDISQAHGIPRDRLHIVAHGQLQPWNRTDPGPNWPWSSYIAKVNEHCGGGGDDDGGDGEIIIDSNNARNDLSKAKIEVSGGWTASSLASGYYGTGYYFAATRPTSDPATFWFYLPEGGTRTVDAWWTAGSNRAGSAPFIAFDAGGGKLGTTYVDQRASGSRWVTLGTWSFSPGWNKVVLSRWTGEGSVVIADAVRVR